MSLLSRPLQIAAIPLGAFRARGVGAFQKIEKRLARRFGVADILILQDELRKILMPVSCRRTHRLVGDSGRLRRGVSVISRLGDTTAAGPEARADALVRVGFAGDHAFAPRRGTPGEARAGQIEAA